MSQAEDELIAEALAVTVGNIQSLKNATPPGIVTFDHWHRVASEALILAKARLPLPEPEPELDGHPELFDT